MFVSLLKTALKTTGAAALLTLVTAAGATAADNSVWHDMDNDRVFDMDETYRPTEGWGASGTVPTDRMPTFDDVKIKVESFGANVTVPMVYPS